MDDYGQGWEVVMMMGMVAMKECGDGKEGRVEWKR